MRVWRLAVPVFAAALFAICGGEEAAAFTHKILHPDINGVYVGPHGPTMTRYSQRLHGEVVDELRRSAMPFKLIGPTAVVVRFSVNRRGELLGIATIRKSRAKIVDDYVERAVREASRRFPPPPADQPGDPLTFTLPVNLQ